MKNQKRSNHKWIIQSRCYGGVENSYFWRNEMYYNSKSLCLDYLFNLDCYFMFCDCGFSYYVPCHKLVRFGNSLVLYRICRLY